MHNMFDNPAAFKPFFGDPIVATYKGMRREGGVSRRILMPMDVYVQRVAKKDGVQGDAVAMARSHSWTVSFPSDKWLDVTEPQISDSLEFIDPECDWKTVCVKVASVSQDCGWWTLKTRSAGDS